LSDKKPCLYGLHSYCVVERMLRDNKIETKNWGSEDWVKVHCAMCVKALYAKAKWKSVKAYSVVNTL